MEYGKSVTKAMMSFYIKEGVEIHMIDWNSHILYISVPKYSDSYVGNIKTADDFAKRIKETWIESGIFPRDCKVKYKIKDIEWNKEMGEKALLAIMMQH